MIGIQLDISCIHIFVGAGYHSIVKEPHYKQLCSEACQKGIEVIKSGGNASDAAVAVIKVLEDSPLTNAGRSRV